MTANKPSHLISSGINLRGREEWAARSGEGELLGGEEEERERQH